MNRKLKLWYRKLKFHKTRNILLFSFLSIPIILVSSLCLIFFNSYFYSFEEYYYMNIHSDLSVYTYNPNQNFTEINRNLNSNLEAFPYKGTVADTIVFKELNFSIYSFNGTYVNSYNETIQFKNLFFSNREIKEFYINKFLPIVVGNIPKYQYEILAPVELKDYYGINLNGTISYRVNNESSFNVKIVGFYKNQAEYIISPKNKFIFFMNSLDNSLFQDQPYQGYTIHRIFLDHKKIDLFNIFSLTSQISQISQIVDNVFSDLIDDHEVISSNSRYFSYEFTEYMLEVSFDLFTIIGPIIIINLIFSILIANYIMNMDERYWENISFFLSEKKIKFQIILDLFLNSVISFSFSFPIGIGVYLLFSNFTQLNTSSFNFYIPNSYFILIFVLFGLFFIFMSYLTVRSYSLKFTSKKINIFSPSTRTSKKRLNIILLLILVMLPIIDKLLYLFTLSIYNPVFALFLTVITVIAEVIALFYPIILILAILFAFSGLIVKAIQFFANIPFRKLEIPKFKLLRKFFQYRRTSIIILIGMLSLNLGFINFYHYREFNQINQNEFETYLQVGCDLKIELSGNAFNNFSEFLKVYDYTISKVTETQGLIITPSIIDNYISMLTLNVSSYYNVLNDISRDNIDKDLLLTIDNLKYNEVIIPLSLKIQNQLNLGDKLTIEMEKALDNGNSSLDPYEIDLEIKGFFNFLPGLPFSKNNLIFFTSTHFNQTVTSQNSSININIINLMKTDKPEELITILNQNQLNFRYVSLNEELSILNKSYQTISNKFASTMFLIFVFMILLMSAFFVYNFIIDNYRYWNLFQFFGIRENDIKKMVTWGLCGIFIISHLLGLLGIFGSLLLYFLEHTTFINLTYYYPVTLSFDFVVFLFNLIYIFCSIFMIWLLITKIMRFRFEYSILSKFNPK